MNRKRRFIWFFFTIALGLALGLYAGWSSNLFKVNSTNLSSLRQDYQADYVLMVAEVYQANPDLNLARENLTYLGSQASLRYVQQAIITAETLGYAREDIDLLANLAVALQTPEQP